MIKLISMLTLSALVAVSGCSNKPIPENLAVDERRIGGLDLNSLTQSEQYAMSVGHIKASPETVFKKIADHQNLRDWVPMIDHEVEVDHSASIVPGESNVGTKRICLFGGDRLVEDIRYWKEGKGYAYSARDSDDLPVTNHLGVIWIESDNEGGSYLIWRQFFEKKSWSLKAQIMPFMMDYVMNGAMQNLVDEWGGEVL